MVDAMPLVLLRKRAHRKGNIRHVRYWSKAIVSDFSSVLTSEITVNRRGEVFPLCDGFRLFLSMAIHGPIA